MKVSYSWLQDFIDLSESPEEISEVLTQTGLEVEGLETTERIRGGLRGLVVGEVLECFPHPNADKLKVTRVDIGDGEPVQIVCGGPNVAKGQKVVVAPVNTTIHPIAGEPFTIKKAKIRGEESRGMICAEDEIGLGQSHDGVIVLDTEVDNGTEVRSLYDIGEDATIEIGLTPNRGDATSHMGTARDLRAFYKRPLKVLTSPKLNINKDRPISVTVENTTACPRYSSVTIRGVKVSESPDWLKQRLQSIDLSPINNIVDITNYVMFSIGQPMHAFDAEVVGDEVIVKTVEKGTKFKTLDEVERTLSDQDLMICNQKGGMCIAGVFGGIDSGIKDTTTDIFLESAHFSADWIRNTATRHGISTDSSFRFERGADPEMTIPALHWAASLITELAGGSLASEYTDYYPNPIEHKKIETTYAYIHKLIGEPISEDRIIEILNLLEIETIDVTNEGFTAIVPPFRSEVTREADLVEEVLRIYGFNNIPLEENLSTDFLASFQEKEPYNLQERVSNFLSGTGYHEILTNSLTNPLYHQKMPLGEGEPVEILNKSSEDLGILKTSPLYTGLESIAYNINRRQKNLKFFEMAKAYELRNSKYKEEELLTFYLTGNQEEQTWRKETSEVQFHDLMQTVQAVLAFLKIELVQRPTDDHPILSYGLQFSVNNKVIGCIGRLQATLEGLYDIKQPVFYAQLNWKDCVKLAKTKLEYRAIPKFPEVKRDLSLVIDKEVRFSRIEEIAFKSERKLLTRTNVFSVYEGDKIEEGKKSYAISFYLQDSEKTLTDKTIDKTMNRLIKSFENELDAIIRK